MCVRSCTCVLVVVGGVTMIITFFVFTMLAYIFFSTPVKWLLRSEVMRIKMNPLKLFASQVFFLFLSLLWGALLCRLNLYRLKRKLRVGGRRGEWVENLTSKIKVWWPLSAKHLSRGNLDRKWAQKHILNTKTCTCFFFNRFTFKSVPRLCV